MRATETSAAARAANRAPDQVRRRVRHGGAVSDLESLLEDDLFRFTRSAKEVTQLELEARRDHRAPHRFLLHALLGVGPGVTEARARALWRTIITHRSSLEAALGRPVPLRAAAIDWLYLLDERRRPFRAMVVSRSALQNTLAKGRDDGLTGLPSRGRFEVALARALLGDSGEGNTLIFIDLDGFKHANDEFGHSRGDEVLRRFGRVVRRALRPGDLVGRMGGDEFAILLPGVTEARANAIASRLRLAFERRCASDSVSFSYGIARARSGESAAALLRRADAAMYRQKRQRKATGTVTRPR